MGCVTVQIPVDPVEVLHTYVLSVVDVNGSPLEGATIETESYDVKVAESFLTKSVKSREDWEEKIVTSNSFVTTTNGELTVKLYTEGNQSELFSSLVYYNTKLKYKVSKKGYYPKSGSVDHYWYGGARNRMRERTNRIGRVNILPRDMDDSVQREKIVLVRPTDYFDKGFVSDLELKGKVIRFIDLIILESRLTKSTLKLSSIDLVTFKGKKYLQFEFNNSNVFNSLKMNKYDIGKEIFDEVIRKILSPLNDYIGNSELFYGYDLAVTGHTKSFSEKDSVTEDIEYRFMIPESIVSKYKDKDISGQQVLDSSIILMDDERVEFRLQ